MFRAAGVRRASDRPPRRSVRRPERRGDKTLKLIPKCYSGHDTRDDLTLKPPTGGRQAKFGRSDAGTRDQRWTHLSVPVGTTSSHAAPFGGAGSFTECRQRCSWDVPG